MKKPYLNEEERFSIRHNTLQGAFCTLNFEYKKYERAKYREHWWLAWIVIRLEMKQMLKPINKQMKDNWIKSDGRRTL